ncbi:MAG TPA: hypothetical protein VHO06_19055, partial [Polyangia bacterium]|nr:hypothetical protein [Polyangia bacterium]
AAGAPPLAPPAPIGLASINEDPTFDTASLSILDPAGGLERGDCLDSRPSSGGSTPLISAAVGLPSQPQRGGDVVLVDRANGTLTSVDPATCQVVRQVLVPNGAQTEPHDVVIVADDKAYVTRYRADAAATTAAAMGDDVVVIDPTTGAFQARLDLDSYASPVAGATILVHPDRAVIADGQVVVSLGEADAGGATFGAAKVVVIDPGTDTVTASVTLGALLDCQGMAYVAASKTLLVACGGDPSDPDQPLQSGIAVVDLGASPPRLVHAITGDVFGDQPVSAAWVLPAATAASPDRAFAGTRDPARIKSDGLYLFDFTLGTAAEIATAAPAAIGPSAATASLLFVPELLGSAPKVQLFDISGAPLPTTGFAPDPANGLGPAAIAWY